MSQTPRPLHSNMDWERLIQVINQNFEQIANSQRVNIIKDETGTPRYIAGHLPDGTYGLVISKQGVDVTTLFE